MRYASNKKQASHCLHRSIIKIVSKVSMLNESAAVGKVAEGENTNASTNTDTVTNTNTGGRASHALSAKTHRTETCESRCVLNC